MSCCCNTTYNYCTPVRACDPAALIALFNDLPNGDYKMRYTFNGVDKYVDLTVTTEDGPVLSEVEFNELYVYNAQLFTDEMVAVKLVVSEVEYDCFLFNTTL